MAVNTTQGIVLAIFGANAGGHLSSLDANATANGNASLATDLSAAAGLILGVDLSSDAAFTAQVLSNLGVVEGTDGYTLASNYFTTNLAAGAGRGDLIAAAVDYLMGSNVDASLSDTATAFSTRVTDGVTYSQGEGASVFGVAQLQTAAGSTSAGVGSSFTLTSDEDTLTGTSGSDTFEGTTTNLSADDRILDSTTTDNDTFNLTATADPVAMDVTNVENININWDAFGSPDIDLDNISGSSTVTLSSSKTGYLGNANFTNVGETNISLGAGVTGTVEIDEAEDNTITNTVAETLNITTADGTIVVNAGAAETVLLSGADNATIVATSADDITVQNAFDTLDLTVGVDADVLLDGASDAVITLRSEADVQLDVNGTFEAETITLAGAGAITLDFAQAADVNGLELVNGGAIILADNFGAASTISDVTHTSITAEASLGADSTVTANDGVSLVFEDDIVNDLTLVLASADDSSSDSATITVEVTQAGTIDVASSTTTDFETLTLIGDGSSDITMSAKVDVADGTLVLQSPTNDLTISAGIAGTVDATAMTTDLTYDQSGAADATVVLGSGDNDVSLAGTSHESTITGGDGDDNVDFATTTGTAAALLGNGDNVVDVLSVTSGDVIVTTGSGDDVITIDSLTSGEVVVNAGDGDNTIDMDPGTLAGAEVVVNAGNGDDTFEFDSANAVATSATESIAIDLGTGTNTLSFAGMASTIDLTAGSFSVAGLNTIAFGGNSDDVVFDGSFLTGQDYRLTGDGDVTDLVFVDHDSAGTYDYSTLQLDGTIAKALGGMDIDGHSGNETITGSDGNDTIDTGDGVNTVTGGLGADSITLGTGKDTIVLGKTSATQTSSFAGANTLADNIDEYIGFDFASEDKIQLSSAAEAYGDGLTLTSSTIINVIDVGSSTVADTFTEMASIFETAASNGTASSATTLYIYYGVETGAGAGTLEDGTYLVINDGVSTITADDTWIKIGGAGGVTGLDASDFTIV